MRLYPSKCDQCEADVVVETTMITAPRGNPPVLIRAKRVHHYRERDEAHFWHWSDDTVVRI